MREAALQAGVKILATDATIVPHLPQFVEHALLVGVSLTLWEQQPVGPDTGGFDAGSKVRGIRELHAAVGEEQVAACRGAAPRSSRRAARRERLAGRDRNEARW